MTAQDRPRRGLHLHVDCTSGAAGDMMLGALIDLGVPVSVIGDALDAIGAGRGRLQVARVVTHGIAASDVKVDTRGELATARPHRHAASERVHDRQQPQAQVPGHDHRGGATHPGDPGDQSRRHDTTHRHDQGQHDHSHHDHSHHDHSHHDHSHHDHSHHDHGYRDHSHHAQGQHAHGHHDHGHHDHGHHDHGHHDHGHHDHSHSSGDHRHASSDHLHDNAPAGHRHATVDQHQAASDHRHGPVPAEHPHDRDPAEHPHDRDPADHHHARGDHAHYHYAAIRASIAAADLTPGTRRRALDIFDRIARAEARLHGMTVDDVAFHEVGAIDSVVDVVGTAAALDWLDPAAVTCTGVAMGHGTLRCAHGVLPVPAPAALEILREAGGVMSDGGVARELCTPTGAAILAATVTRWSAAPGGRPVAIGWGAGDAALADRPNALRVIALEPVFTAAGLPGTADRVWQIDANLDDMSPELCGPASEAVFAAGALDVWWTPITMKKGRPALMISALASDDARGAVAAAILRETTTIGVRYAARERSVLARAIREVTTPFGPIPVKVARDGDTLWNAAPEFEACAAAAHRHGVAVKRVFAAALAAFEAER